MLKMLSKTSANYVIGMFFPWFWHLAFLRPRIGIDGEFELVFGTSCSSPVVGSMITLINDARLEIGKGPVGFLNPSVCFKYNT